MEEKRKMGVEIINNKMKAIIISFIGGVIQATTFVFVYILYLFAYKMETYQNIIIICMIISTELLSYVLLRMSMILVKDHKVDA